MYLESISFFANKIKNKTLFHIKRCSTFYNYELQFLKYIVVESQITLNILH